MAILFQLADDGLGINALTAIVIAQGGLHGLLGQNAAMHLDGGQTVQRFHHSLVGQLQGLFNALALDQLGGHAGGGNGGAAAEGQELHVLDDAVLDLQVHTHDVAALGVAHFAHAVGVRQFAHIAGMGEMIHNFFTIHACHVETLLCWFKSRGGANAEPLPGGKGHCPKCLTSSG